MNPCNVANVSFGILLLALSLLAHGCVEIESIRYEVDLHEATSPRVSGVVLCVEGEIPKRESSPGTEEFPEFGVRIWPRLRPLDHPDDVAGGDR